MKNSEELRQQLRSINRKSYPAYKRLKGLYHLEIIFCPSMYAGRSFASPSHVSIQISRDPDFPSNIIKIHLPGLLIRDYLHVSLKNEVRQYSFRAKGFPAKAACSLSVTVVRRFPGQPVK